MHGFCDAAEQQSRVLIFMTPGHNIQRMFAGLAELTEKTHGEPARQDVVTLCAEYDIAFAPAG
jgi:hypothetical protein